MSQKFSIAQKIEAEPLKTKKEESNESILTDNKEEIYFSTFNELVLNINLEDELDSKKHNEILNAICPALSSQFIKDMNSNVPSLIERYGDQIDSPQELEYFKKLPDASSKITFIFKDIIYKIRKDLKDGGYEHTMRVNESFYLLLNMLYDSLPMSYPLALIEIWNPNV